MAGSVSTDIKVAEFAGQLFFRLWRASHTRTAQALNSVGLTPALFALLNVLGAREGTIQQQLSSDMGIDPSAMVKLIDELENAGLAERRRRPGDRRAWEVGITPKGRRTVVLAVVAQPLRRLAEQLPHVELLSDNARHLIAAEGVAVVEQEIAAVRRHVRHRPPAPPLVRDQLLDRRLRHAEERHVAIVQ